MAKSDLAQTQVLAELFDTPQEKRDAGWVERFYATVPDAPLMAFQPQVIRGPDGHPYFQLAIPDPGPFEGDTVAQVLDHALLKGLGVVVWASSGRGDSPEWVFRYGDLLAYKLYGRFDDRSPEHLAREGGARRIETAEEHRYLVTDPGEDYLPSRTRELMLDYIRKVSKHPAPKIRLMYDGALNPPKNLLLNITAYHFGGDQQKLADAMERLGWFLPPSYSMVTG
jgi:hypothetical protein